MLTRALSSVAVATLMLAAPAAAQELIVLELQVAQGGSPIAAPTIKVRDGDTAKLRLPAVLDVDFTPTRMDTGQIRINLDFQSDDWVSRAQLVVDEEHPGTLTWATDGGEPVQLSISVAG